jgi:hypothetical protein
MAAKSVLLYQTSKKTTARRLEEDTSALLKASEKELRALLKKHGVPESAAKELSRVPIKVAYKGAGLAAETVALAVSLTPLIHALRPVLVPLTKSITKVAEKIALDTWEMLKRKLWDKKHIALKAAAPKPKNRKKSKKTAQD